MGIPCVAAEEHAPAPAREAATAGALAVTIAAEKKSHVPARAVNGQNCARGLVKVRGKREEKKRQGRGAFEVRLWTRTGRLSKQNSKVLKRPVNSFFLYFSPAVEQLAFTQSQRRRFTMSALTLHATASLVYY